MPRKLRYSISQTVHPRCPEADSNSSKPWFCQEIYFSSPPPHPAPQFLNKYMGERLIRTHLALQKASNSVLTITSVSSTEHKNRVRSLQDTFYVVAG